jgi:hypothetical protein
MTLTDNFLRLLARGDAAAVTALFAGEPLIDDPEAGRLEGADRVADFVRESGQWYAETGATTETIRTTVSRPRAVTEQVLRWAGTELPMAVVAELTGPGRLAAVRIYHSSWPLTGGHAVRPPLLPGDPDVVLSDVVGDYHRSLGSKHLDGILDTFGADAYVREPAGGEHVHRGPEARAAFYAGLFEVGEILLEHCTVTDDGVAAALEYNVVQWGPKEIPPQAGVAVYERGRSGKLAAARIYDDVDI